MIAADKSSPNPPHRFEFARDTFAFANELFWEYRFDSATGKTQFSKREPKPDYAHRCFVLVRSARQFLYHARFDAAAAIGDDEIYVRLIRQVVGRNPRKPCAETAKIMIPGFASLRDFSAARGQLLKSTCGGAWQSYVLRSHWRMVFPISREHQVATVSQLLTDLKNGRSPIVHLVCFPALTINHGMIVFDAVESEKAVEFSAYDPNDPAEPTRLTFDRASRTFSLPANRYWAGGPLNIIGIYRSWLM